MTGTVYGRDSSNSPVGSSTEASGLVGRAVPASGGAAPKVDVSFVNTAVFRLAFTPAVAGTTNVSVAFTGSPVDD